MTESDDDIVGRRVITDINQTPAELWVSFTHHPDDPDPYHIEDFDTVRAAVYGAPFRYVRHDADDDIVGRMNLEDHNMALLEENKRLKAEVDSMMLDAGRLRLCLSCGAKAPTSHPRGEAGKGCPSPDACTWDMTMQEAWQHWRKEYHALRDEYHKLNAALAGVRASLLALQEPQA